MVKGDEIIEKMLLALGDYSKVFKGEISLCLQTFQRKKYKNREEPMWKKN